MNSPHDYNKVMTLQQAQQFQESLAKHNPFARLAPEKQYLANKAHAVIQRKVKQEEFEALEDALF